MIKKIILLIFSLFIFSASFGLSQQEKIDYLQKQNINFDKEILQKNQVSRYEVMRYLNYAKCFDCMYPPKKIKEELNLNWFEHFKKQDRFYLNDITLKDKYYYCVLNLAKLDYVHGYPFSVPVCGGKFCGANNMYFGELLQVVVNIISEKILNNYTIKDKDIFYKHFLELEDSAKDKNIIITESDKKIAEKIKNNQEKTYRLQNFQEFYLYQKYCVFYPEDCDFKNFGKIKKGHYSLSVVNILYNENMITLKEALNLNPQRAISGKDLLDWVYKIKKISVCRIDNDYDKDGIKNKIDNCLYTYNPNQKDTDKDGIGDVCDDDIDNDGIKNPIGIIDDKGNIITSKLKLCKGNIKCDNCLFTKNTDQKDIDNNGIGGACENKGYDLIGIKIVCSPNMGYAPLKTKCIAKTVGPVKKVVWTYKGNVIGQGWNIPYIFKTKGFKTITATAIGENNDTATTNSYFKVKDKEKTLYEVGLQIKANPTYAPIGSKIVFSKEVKGDIDNIRWHFGDGSIYTKKVNVNPIKVYPKAGYYKVLAEALKNNKVVAKSYEYVRIYKLYRKKPTSYLRANPLQTYINQNVKFLLITKNIKQENISKIEWLFGDNTKKTTQTLFTNHAYKQIGAYPVKATIYLKDGTKLDNMITIKVINNKKYTTYGASMVGVPLQQFVGKNVDFTIYPRGFNINDVKKINWLYGDGTKFETHSFKSSHTYYSAGKKYVIANITLNNNEIITTSLTEVIIGKDICSNLENAKKQLKCDMDKDGIPDMCDDDIDGDGVKNLMGLILYDKKDCSIDDDNTDPNRKNEEKEITKKGGDIDNCPFRQNSDQKDSNQDGAGDVCNNKCLDYDGDGICNDQDSCPEIPENYNGIEDKDGCPEIETTTNLPEFKVENCNSCPCQFADYAGPFIPGSIIKAILVDPTNPSRLYNVSNPVQY